MSSSKWVGAGWHFYDGDLPFTKKINTLIINAKLRPHSLLIHLTFMDFGEGVDQPSWEYFHLPGVPYI